MADIKCGYFEISFPALLAITNDIMQRAISLDIPDNVLDNCVIRIPDKQDTENFCYDFGFPAQNF